MPGSASLQPPAAIKRGYRAARRPRKAGPGTAAAPEPGAAGGARAKPRRGRYCCLRRRRTAKERAQGATAVLGRMESYALWRLRRSRGAPAALNQSAMAACFQRQAARADPGQPGGGGPSLRTISRQWGAFTDRMNALGCRLVRAHSPGVGVSGKRLKRPRRGAVRASKLGWVIYQAAWAGGGRDVMAYIGQAPGPASGPLVRARWLRDERRRLLPPEQEKWDAHYAQFAPAPGTCPPKRPRPKPTPGAAPLEPPGLTVNDHPLAWLRRHGFAILPWTLRKIWAIARKYLPGEGAAEPLAYRAIELWRAGLDGGALFPALEWAAAWAKDAETGHRGRVAAALLAHRVMGQGTPREPPTSAQYAAWVGARVQSWQGRTVRRIHERNQARGVPVRAPLLTPAELQAIREQAGPGVVFTPGSLYDVSARKHRQARRGPPPPGQA